MRGIWECPICGVKIGLPNKGELAQVPLNYMAKCELQEHLWGLECIAFRQPTRAKEIHAAKNTDAGSVN
jgi:hypothetical protein